MKISVLIVASFILTLSSGVLLARADVNCPTYFPYGEANYYARNPYAYSNCPRNFNATYGYYGTGMPGQIILLSSNSGYPATNAGYQNNYGQTPSANLGQVAKTDVAYPVGARSATLAGTVNPNSFNTSYYFEYGTSPDLDHSTASRNAGNGTSNLSISMDISGLTPNTTYYYRVGAESERGIAVGATLSFTTRSSVSVATTAQPIATATTGSVPANATTNNNSSGNTPAVTDAYTPTNSYGMGAQLLSAFGLRASPCFTLSGKLSSKSVAPGGTVSYTVSGKNGCSTDFMNAVLRITLPDTVKFTSSTAAYAIVDGNTYVYNLGNFPNASTLSVAVTGIANTDAPDNVPIVFTGTVDFDDSGIHQMIGTTSSGEISVSIFASIANLFRSKGSSASPANGQATLINGQVADTSSSKISTSTLANILLVFAMAGLVIWLLFRGKKVSIPARVKALTSR